MERLLMGVGQEREKKKKIKYEKGGGKGADQF
jgi:hypothetical protein